MLSHRRPQPSLLMTVSSGLAMLLVLSCCAVPAFAQARTSTTDQRGEVLPDTSQKTQRKSEKIRDERTRDADQETQRAIQQAFKNANTEEQVRLRQGIHDAQKGLAELKELGTIIPPFAYRLATGFPDGLFGTPDKRIDVDFRRISIEDALRKVFKSANVDYELDCDLPEEAVVSLQVPNIRLSTVVELLTQAADVKWSMEIRRGADGKSLKTTYHIGKTSPDVLKNPMDVSIISGNAPPTPPAWPNWSNGPETSGRPAFPDGISVNVPGVGFNNGPGTAKAYVGGPGTRYYSMTIEEKATFICPHCKGHVSVLRQRPLPRTNADGTRQSTKRTGSPEWKFCPFCGKPLEFEKKVDTNGKDAGDGPCGKSLYGSLMLEEKKMSTCTKLPIDYRYEDPHDRF